MENVSLLESGDGSHTLYNAQLDETYHSTHGALTESRHVFITHGLTHFLDLQEEITVLEIGFGTGLNALLSLEKSLETAKKVTYHTLETYPLTLDVINGLNYSRYFSPTLLEPFLAMHQANWNQEVAISENFYLTKWSTPLQEFNSSIPFDVIYFDAFAPRKQPEMWSLENLEKSIHNLKKGGIFVTYCATGQLRRDLKALGMEVEKLPGPPGKREMTRGWK